MTKLVQLFKQLLPAAPRQNARELAYLNECVSLCDLERREREISGGKFTAARTMPGFR